jgi:hypothetical protein
MMKDLPLFLGLYPESGRKNKEWGVVMRAPALWHAHFSGLQLE